MNILEYNVVLLPRLAAGYLLEDKESPLVEGNHFEGVHVEDSRQPWEVGSLL